MHLFFDSVPEFTEGCCRLLREADLRGVYAANWIATAADNKANDIFIQAWLEALPAWTEPAQPAAAIDMQASHIMSVGLAHHTLLTEVACTLANGIYSTELLVRIQPHFPDINLNVLLPQVRTADHAYEEARSKHLNWQICSLGRPKGTDNTDKNEAPDLVKPPRIIDPATSPDIRAAALIYQLLSVLKETRPGDPSLLGYWNLWEQPDPLARYIDNYCRYDYPDNISALIAIQHQVVDHGLDTKLALLRVTLQGLVTRRLNETRTRLAAHFDGDMPGIDIVRFVDDPQTGNASNTLRLEAWLGNDRWQIACAGAASTITEATAQAFLAALDQQLDVDTAQMAHLNDDFEAALNGLVALDDREFQGFLREMQSSTLELVLSGLPDTEFLPPDFDEFHPFYRKVARNMSKRAWEMIEYEVERQSRAPLNAFELFEILGVLAKVRPTLFQGKQSRSLFTKLNGGVPPALPRLLELPDITISPELKLTKRKPRQTTLLAGETEWLVNRDELLLLVCQLKHRHLLQTDKTIFNAAWAGEWLAGLKAGNPVQLQRLLRHQSRTEALLLTGQTPQDGHWPEISRLILAHPMFTTYPVQ